MPVTILTRHTTVSNVDQPRAEAVSIVGVYADEAIAEEARDKDRERLRAEHLGENAEAHNKQRGGDAYDAEIVAELTLEDMDYYRWTVETLDVLASPELPSC